MKVVLGGITLGDGPNATTDGDGNTWLTTEMTGWESIPSRASNLDYSMRHGGVVANPTYGPKAIGLTGVCKSPTSAAFWLGYNKLLGVVSSLKVGVNLVVTEDVDKTVVVVRGAEPRFRIHPGHFEWELSLTAYDPLKYGVALTTAAGAGATVSLTNTGNIESPNVIVTTTGAGKVAVRNAGTGVRLASSVAMSSGTVIDQRARTAYLGAENRYFQLASTSLWWGLAPGANSIVNEGDAPLSITYRPAWA